MSLQGDSSVGEREGACKGQSGGLGSSETGRQEGSQAGEELAGLRCEGPAWRLRQGSGGEGHTLTVCEGLLEQALGCSELADVRFVFDDGESGVGGHRGVLCGVSEVFLGMFRAGMEESETGRVRMRGVGRESFRTFLEFVYVGRCGGNVCAADGRELWVLAEVYQVEGLKEWLVKEACEAMQYVKSAEGAFEELGAACLERACWNLGEASEGALQGVGVEAAYALLLAHCGNGRLWRECDVLAGFKFVERWVGGNGGAKCVGAGDVDRLVGLLDLSKLPLDVLSGVLRPSGLVSDLKLLDVSMAMNERQRKENQDLSAGGLAFERAGSYGGGDDDEGVFASVCGVAVDGEGADQLLAAVDDSGKCVHFFKAEGGERVMTIGPDVEGLGEFGNPQDVVFNGRGELLVSDYDRNCIDVFDRDWGNLRSIGRQGSGEGELEGPDRLALSPEGHIIVSDEGNSRVQVLREDGTFVRAFGSEGTGDGQLDGPCGVAVGADGSVVVADFGNARVHIFDNEGGLVRTFGSRGMGAGEFEQPSGVCVLPGGQILVSDGTRNDVQVFSWEGVYLRSIGAEGDSRVELFEPYGIAVDSGGRVFVGCQGASGHAVEGWCMSQTLVSGV